MRLIDAEALLHVARFADSGYEVRNLIRDAPTIEPPVPDRVLASDVVGKIRVYNDKGDLEFRTCESLSPPSEYICIAESETTAVATILALPCAMVADMLQGCLDRGERVDWPDGSPGCRFRKAEAEPPTLLEVAERVVASFEKADTIEHSLFEVSDLKEAIEREKAKQGEGL